MVVVIIKAIIWKNQHVIFIPRDILKDKLKAEFHEFIMYEKKKLESLVLITEKIP